MFVHLTTKENWRMAQQMGEVRTESLESQGFIHCSTPEQMVGVANRFYRGVPDLVVLWLAPDRVLAEVRWEAPIHPSAPVEADVQSVLEDDPFLFPHIYGPINLEAVEQVADFVPDADGIFRRIPRPTH